MSLPWGAARKPPGAGTGRGDWRPAPGSAWPTRRPCPKDGTAACARAAAHLLTVFSGGTGLSGAESRSALLICRAPHTWEWRLAHCRGVSPSLFFKFTSESRERKRLKGKRKPIEHSGLNGEPRRRGLRRDCEQRKRREHTHAGWLAELASSRTGRGAPGRAPPPPAPARRGSPGGERVRHEERGWTRGHPPAGARTDERPRCRRSAPPREPSLPRALTARTQLAELLPGPKSERARAPPQGPRSRPDSPGPWPRSEVGRSLGVQRALSGPEPRLPPAPGEAVPSPSCMGVRAGPTPPVSLSGHFSQGSLPLPQPERPTLTPDA